MFGLISKREHDAVVAERDLLAKDAHHWWERYNRKAVEAHDLRARLARFTSPRARDEKGRYLPEVRS